jgi:callose synthase
MALVVQNQMASELHGMLAGNVSMVTGDNMKPAYGGEDESFLSLVVTPIYEVIAKVSPLILIKVVKLILN